MSDLKPCPFCGNTPTIRIYNGKDGWRDRYAVLCRYDEGGCGAESGLYHYQAEAIEAWNRRVPEAIVRCKDCKHNPKDTWFECPMSHLSEKQRPETAWCWKGERRTDA